MKEYFERFKSNNIRKKQSSLNQAPYSSCRPHMRMVGKYIYPYDDPYDPRISPERKLRLGRWT